MKNTIIEAVALLVILVLFLTSCGSGNGRYQATSDGGSSVMVLDTRTGVLYGLDGATLLVLDFPNKTYTTDTIVKK